MSDGYLDLDELRWYNVPLTSEVPSSESEIVCGVFKFLTVDGRNPAAPGMYKTLVNNGIGYLPYQRVHDFFHQQ